MFAWTTVGTYVLARAIVARRPVRTTLRVGISSPRATEVEFFVATALAVAGSFGVAALLVRVPGVSRIV